VARDQRDETHAAELSISAIRGRVAATAAALFVAPTDGMTSRHLR